jgi:hypothetical protein
MVMDVNGCKIVGLENNLTGDSLSYLAGPRWIPPLSGRWVPYVQVLFGGNKLTQELMFPEKKSYFEALARSLGSTPPDRSQYTQQFERNGFSAAAGFGLDFHFNRALAFRFLSLEYSRCWINDMNGFAPPNGLQFKTGLVLHVGSW